VPDVLVDAGALIALLDRDDAAHERCVETLKRIRHSLVTVWPALTEAMHLLAEASRGPDALCDMVADGALKLILCMANSKIREYFLRVLGSCYDCAVRDLAVLVMHLLATVARLAGPGGARSVLAESVLVKHQLLILNRSRKRSPNLRPSDRMIAGLCTLFIRPARRIRSAMESRSLSVRIGHPTHSLGARPDGPNRNATPFRGVFAARLGIRHRHAPSLFDLLFSREYKAGECGSSPVAGPGTGPRWRSAMGVILPGR
jgi:predicted nucleic acid-binding protein